MSRGLNASNPPSEPPSPRKPKKTVTFHEEVTEFEYAHCSFDSLTDDKMESLSRDCTRKVTL